MRFEDVRSVLGATPHMTPAQGRIVYDFICEKRPKRILELGFAHGTSACYMAAALDEVGGDGRIVTIDRGGNDRSEAEYSRVARSDRPRPPRDPYYR
jgi:predicted O-methyltransferase YrrM